MSEKRELTAEETARRNQDYFEIQNVMGKYVYWHFADEHEKVFSLFAKDPDTRAQIANWGRYYGIEGVKRLFVGVHEFLDGTDRRGRLHFNPVSTPVIEVAGDGKTAKGLWMFTGANSCAGDDGESYEAYWSWARYAIDFLKEDGEWKIWHYACVGLFQTKFEESWVFEPDHEKLILPDELKADEEGGYHWQYSPSVCTENMPAPPEPYWTFSETFSY